MAGGGEAVQPGGVRSAGTGRGAACGPSVQGAFRGPALMLSMPRSVYDFSGETIPEPASGGTAGGLARLGHDYPVAARKLGAVEQLIGDSHEVFGGGIGMVAGADDAGADGDC